LLHCGEFGRLGVRRFYKSEEMGAATDNRHAPCAGFLDGTLIRERNAMALHGSKRGSLCRADATFLPRRAGAG
jgi:hypothetical protein